MLRTMKFPTGAPLLYETVAEKIQQQIDSGALRPGEKVPSIRRAVLQHGVSVSTAVQAYRMLEDRGVIEAHPKSGFFVRARLREAIREPTTSSPKRLPAKVGVAVLLERIFDLARLPEVVPFGAAQPTEEMLPVARLNGFMAAAARRSGGRGVSYDLPPGSDALRRQLARRSLDWGSTLSPDDFITTCGGTEALALSLRAVTQPGDVVAIEAPTYFGLLQTLETLRLRAVEIPMHPRDGMDLDALERALQRGKIAACVAVPNFNNPLGSLMPDAHKQRLVELLARRQVPLIEDDINGELTHAGPRPRTVHSFEREGRVLLCGSFSKTLAPGYRVGWVAPGRYAESVKAFKYSSTLATATLPQIAIADYLAAGGYERHLRSLRRRFASQVARVSEAVGVCFPPGIRVTRPAGGFVLWVELPQGVSALRLHELALAEKISIAPGPMFSATQGFPNFFRLNCGQPWTSRTEGAVETLGRLVKRML